MLYNIYCGVCGGERDRERERERERESERRKGRKREREREREGSLFASMLSRPKLCGNMKDKTVIYKLI